MWKALEKQKVAMIKTHPSSEKTEHARSMMPKASRDCAGGVVEAAAWAEWEAPGRAALMLVVLILAVGVSTTDGMCKRWVGGWVYMVPRSVAWASREPLRRAAHAGGRRCQEAEVEDSCVVVAKVDVVAR